ncbi:hypothetical protein RRG08_025154 [Elysia crispata]|uniref:Uncharacterized protein n=1 Tax=Elysia crispata TaxID=231223 RepID=A0AAE0YBV0_9GAST|nr:hypothetical protein RRG08_025154 [Elysia crispata]
MPPASLLLLLCSCLLGLRFWRCEVEAFTQDHRYSLMEYLFNGYRPEVRPTSDGQTTFLYVALHLLSIQGLDEKSQELGTSFIVEAFWYDDWLAWDPSQYGNISDFLYPQSNVWLPDLIIENSEESQRQLGYKMNMVRVNNLGFIHWKPSQVIKTACDIDVTYYPFDTQSCKIIISTWMSTVYDIDIVPHEGNVGIILDRYSQSGTWKLLSHSMEMLPNENDLTRIQFSLKLKRLRTFYILNIILPVLFLSFTASLVFLLPAEAGEKIGMGITVLLAYAVYLTIIADNMPQTSLQVSYLAVYLTLLLGLTAMGVVLAVVVLHIHHKSDDCKIGKRTERVIRKLRAVFCISKEKAAKQLWAIPFPPHDTKEKGPTNSRPQSKVAVTPVSGDEAVSPPPSYTQIVEEEKITWPKVAETMDRIMFIFTSCLIVITTAVFIPLLAFGS